MPRPCLLLVAMTLLGGCAAAPPPAPRVVERIVIVTPPPVPPPAARVRYGRPFHRNVARAQAHPHPHPYPHAHPHEHARRPGHYKKAPRRVHSFGHTPTHVGGSANDHRSAGDTGNDRPLGRRRK